ncbi:MAG: ATP-dependent helicase UvrD/PcrA [Actinomycetota bacterium]|nr:ATP-dependent helicase UvrD/PcrA [Actinomycetota bacterium]
MLEQMFESVQLTEEQRRAATYQGGNLLIVAGAGTGKTTTLTARLGHLVSSGVPPERILLLTFSRRAAAELLRRADQVTGREVAAAAWGGTFHAIANRLLRRHGRAIGVQPSFTVLDRADTADLLALVRDELTGPRDRGGHPDGPRAQRRARKETLADILSRCTNARTPLSAMLYAHYPWCAEERAEMRDSFEAYTARKRARGVLDYDDLLLCWGALLEAADVAMLLRAQFDHILVDEYQDTNPLQADLLEAMCGGGALITAVGDDAQAIYSFRAAAHRNIMEFPVRFSAEMVTLEQNHRSTPAILAATNAVIAEAAERHPKQLWSRREVRGRPALVRCDDESDQSRQVCARILEHHEQGTLLMAQAVLVRSNHHSDLLELELTARNIPFVKYGGLRFLEAAHVKDLLCLLRLAENPHDELAWFRLLQFLDGVGPATARRVTGDVVTAMLPLAALEEAAGGRSVSHEARTGALDLVAAIRQAATLGVQRAGPAVERVRLWLDPRLEHRYNDVEARRADLEQLTLAAAGASTLRQFLADLTLDPPAATSDLAGPPHLDEDFITISTIHSAKGCEWDVVHILHVADGNIPSDMATGDPEAVEEERRLLYVAMTRARNHLYAYLPLRYHHRRFGQEDPHGYAQLSRFFTPGVLACLDDPGKRAAAGPGDGPSLNHMPDHPAMQRLDRAIASLWD